LFQQIWYSTLSFYYFVNNLVNLLNMHISCIDGFVTCYVGGMCFQILSKLWWDHFIVNLVICVVASSRLCLVFVGVCFVLLPLISMIISQICWIQHVSRDKVLCWCCLNIYFIACAWLQNALLSYSFLMIDTRIFGLKRVVFLGFVGSLTISMLTIDLQTSLQTSY